MAADERARTAHAWTCWSMSRTLCVIAWSTWLIGENGQRANLWIVMTKIKSGQSVKMPAIELTLGWLRTRQGQDTRTPAGRLTDDSDPAAMTRLYSKSNSSVAMDREIPLNLYRVFIHEILPNLLGLPSIGSSTSSRSAWLEATTDSFSTVSEGSFRPTTWEKE